MFAHKNIGELKLTWNWLIVDKRFVANDSILKPEKQHYIKNICASTPEKIATV